MYPQTKAHGRLSDEPTRKSRSTTPGSDFIQGCEKICTFLGLKSFAESYLRNTWRGLETKNETFVMYLFVQLAIEMIKYEAPYRIELRPAV